MRIIVLLSAALALVASSHAAPQGGDLQFSLREDIRAGAGLFQVAQSLDRLPQSKRYFQLLPAQRDVLRSLYVDMRVSDDPPYPASGLSMLFGLLQLHARKIKVQGELALEVSVDACGQAMGSRVIYAPSEEMGRFAMAVVKRTRFSPGLCGATPCAMPFPVALLLRGE